VALRHRLSAGFALSSALQGCGSRSTKYVSKNHSSHPVQRLRSGQGLGSKGSDCNCRDGSAIFVESEHPPNGECPGKCPRPAPRVYLRKPRAKNVIGAGSLEWRDLSPASQVCLRPNSSTAEEKGWCNPASNGCCPPERSGCFGLSDCLVLRECWNSGVARPGRDGTASGIRVVSFSRKGSRRPTMTS